MHNIVVASFYKKNNVHLNNRAAICSDTAAYWDNYVIDYLTKNEKSKGQIDQYIHLFYKRLVSLALGRLVLAQKLRILKVDLWNEGVEISRDILNNFEGIETYGFDLSKNICNLAKARLDKTGVVQATCQNIPYISGNFDLVLDLSTIDHIPFHKTSQVFEEYYRVLKPKGLLAIAFWQSNLATKYLLEVNPEQLYFDSKKVADSLEDIGFKIVGSYNVGALLTMLECNFWVGKFLYWRLKAAFERRLFEYSTKLEPCLYNLLGGLRVYYAIHP